MMRPTTEWREYLLRIAEKLKLDVEFRTGPEERIDMSDGVMRVSGGVASGFTCPRCGAISHNPTDARERYCGRCKVFVDDEAEIERLRRD